MAEKQPVLTLDERIEKTLKEVEFEGDMDLARRSIRLLIEKVASPESFCPKCEDRLAYNKKESLLRCFSCGYEEKLDKTETPEQPARKDIPEAAAKAIRRTTEPTSRGEKIRELANSAGTAPPTEEDKRIVQSVTGNRDVNFV